MVDNTESAAPKSLRALNSICVSVNDDGLLASLASMPHTMF